MFRDIDYLKCVLLKLFGSGKSGYSKCSDRPTVKILTMVIRAHDGHAKFQLSALEIPDDNCAL